MIHIGNAWLKTLLYTFEDVPVCISVAAALKVTPGNVYVYMYIYKDIYKDK
jgi:hypothetical protein